jgi:hypothetical protein
MLPPNPDGSQLTVRERDAIKGLLQRVAAVAQFLKENPLPPDPTAEALYHYLARLKEIQGNTDNGVSLVACLMAKQYLNRHLPMVPFDAAVKPQGASGLDIDERTVAGERVVGEVKTTTPYGATDLGAAQRASFEKDFAKLNAAPAAHRFFFVTDSRTFDLMRRRYAARIPGVRVVLLPGGDSFVA